MKSRAVVFVTDAGFLMPSIHAAIQVDAQQDVTDVADIFVITVDLDEEKHARAEEAFSTATLKFLKLSSSTFLTEKDAYFNKQHFSKTALGRLALQDALPTNYEHVVYLDGDVQVLGDISPLVRHTVESGKIAAVPDYLWLCAGEAGRFWQKHKRYLAKLGISDPIAYFNSGVIAFQMSTWREMAPKALAYFNAHSRNCLYYDQSALNAVFHGQQELLSPEYNLNSLYAELDDGQRLTPRIAHFTGGNKPWWYPGPPWNGRFLDSYRDLVNRHPSLFDSEMIRLSPEREEQIDLVRKTNHRRSVLMPLRLPLRRYKFHRFLKQSEFCC